MNSIMMEVPLAASITNELETLARATRRSEQALAAEAVADYVAREKAILAGIEAGIADMQAGHLVSHDDAMSRIEATIVAAERHTGT
jgi:predicted transcriptional regulator